MPQIINIDNCIINIDEIVLIQEQFFNNPDYTYIDTSKLTKQMGTILNSSSTVSPTRSKCTVHFKNGLSVMLNVSLQDLKDLLQREKIIYG